MNRVQDVKKVFGETLLDIMKQNKNVYMVDVDLMRIAGTDAIPSIYPERYVNVGIAEQNAVSTAVGIASMGKTVFVSAFCSFLGTRASDQCLNSLCYNNLNVKLVGTYAGISSGVNGGTHISISDIASFRSMPGMTIIEVSDGMEMEWAIREAVKIEGPVYIRVPKGPLNKNFTDDTLFSVGKGIVLSEINKKNDKGIRVALITSGITTAYGREAVKILEEIGIQVTQVHMTSIKPFDRDLVIKLASSHDVIVTADNHSVAGGLGSTVCEITASNMPIKVVRLGIEDEFCDGITEKELAKRHNISPEKIVDVIRSLKK